MNSRLCLILAIVVLVGGPAGSYAADGEGAAAAECEPKPAKGPPIATIQPVAAGVLELLDPPFRTVYETVFDGYNAGETAKRNPIRVRGSVDVDGRATAFTLTIEEAPGGLQTLVIELVGLGTAVISTEPARGEATFDLTRTDGRRPISGRARLR